jgi:hypothetical protein
VPMWTKTLLNVIKIYTSLVQVSMLHASMLDVYLIYSFGLESNPLTFDIWDGLKHPKGSSVGGRQSVLLLVSIVECYRCALRLIVYIQYI